MPVRAIRGAVQVEADQPEAILTATRALLLAMVERNAGLRPEDLASVLFTATPDLRATYPAEAARRLEWTDVALICAQEMAVPGSLPRVVRLLAHWNTDRSPSSIRHVYLGNAAALRPDLAGPAALGEPEAATPVTDQEGPRT